MTSLQDVYVGHGLDADDAALCTAAMALISEDGIAGFDLDRVDARAGLPPGTCRGRFPRQPELLAAILEQTAGEFRTGLDAALGRHPGDPVAAIAEWVWITATTRRESIRTLCSLLLDAPTRRQVSMYADALLFGWENLVASRFNLTPEQLRGPWLLVEGWMMATIVHGRPIPEQDVLAAQIRALLTARA